MTAKLKQIIAAVAGRRLAVIGDSMVDRFLWGRVDRISPEAPVPVVRLERETVKLGGAANVACSRALARALGVGRGAVELDPASRGRRKRVRVAGDAEALAARLQELAAGGAAH